MLPLFASSDDHTLDTVLDGIGDAVCVTDSNMVFVGANRNFARFYGHEEPASLLGKNALEVYPGFRQSVFYEACARTAQTGETTTRFGFSNNIQRWVVMRCYQLGPDRYVMVVHKVTDDTAKLGYVPQSDTLTSLPNRWAFEHDAQTLSDSLQHTGLVLIDISHFRDINETLGFPAGDRCLMQVAARVRKAALINDRVYRVGNDQFLVLGSGLPLEMGQRKDQLLQALAEPIELGDQLYVLRCNLGVCVTTATLAGSRLLTHAEQALAFAKANKSGYAEYSDAIGRTSYDPALYKGIRDALDHDELVVLFQPQVDLIDGKACGAEALVRWQHPQRGLVPPSEFLPFAEESGLIVELDRAVATKTLRQSVRLQACGLAVPLSFNLSAQSMCDESTVAFMEEQLRATGADPKLVGVEITETSLMTDVDTSRRVIEAFKAMGMHVSIDDFGSGYSSMAYLLRYPSHFLKIDRDFIRDLHLGGTHHTMVKNLIGLAHGLGIGVVAEGVETAADADLLKAFECDIAQGYYFARPLPADQLEAWLEKKQVGALESKIR